MKAKTKNIYTIEHEKHQAFLNFLEVITVYSRYHQDFIDSYFNRKRDSIENYYDGSIKMIQQFEPNDLDQIVIFTKNNGDLRINEVEKRIFSNAIKYARIHYLDLKKDYYCTLNIVIMDDQPIMDTKIKTTIIIKAISQEYLEMSDEDYKEYLCGRASDIFTEKVLNIYPFFNEVGGGYYVPSFSYKLIEYV